MQGEALDDTLNGNEAFMERRIYLDYNATAKIRPEVIDALAAMATVGNASSVHGAGRDARQSVEARAQVAMLVGQRPTRWCSPAAVPRPTTGNATVRPDANFRQRY